MVIHKLIHRMRGRLNQPAPPRYLGPIGDRDVDRWVVEGLSGYGSTRRAVYAGVGAGAALPWLFAVLSIVYGWVNNLFAPATSRASYGPARLWELAVLYGGQIIIGTIVFGLLGVLFALSRRKLLRLRFRVQRTDYAGLSALLSSRWVAAVFGWGVYAVWALWPRADGQTTFEGALYHPWLWVFFGILFSAYLHRGLHAFLYRLYYRDWESGCRAVVHRLLDGALNISSPCHVKAEGDTGRVVVTNFPKGHGLERLVDLVQRIPGVTSVSVGEAGEAQQPQREIMTLYVPDSERDQLPLITIGRTLFTLGVLSGLAVYVVGLSYALTRGKFMLWSNLIVALAIQVEAVGIVIGYGLRRIFVRRAQRELPRHLERTLHFLGKELESFSFGRTWEEARVRADLSRNEAKEHLLPVAARFGLKRLLVEAPVARS